MYILRNILASSGELHFESLYGNQVTLYIDRSNPPTGNNHYYCDTITPSMEIAYLSRDSQYPGAAEERLGEIRQRGQKYWGHIRVELLRAIEDEAPWAPCKEDEHKVMEYLSDSFDNSKFMLSPTKIYSLMKAGSPSLKPDDPRVRELESAMACGEVWKYYEAPQVWGNDLESFLNMTNLLWSKEIWSDFVRPHFYEGVVEYILSKVTK